MILIIGAGIAGLYAGYLLKKKGINDFMIFEKNKRVGGKIVTLYASNKTPIELGPSIVHSNQDNIMGLLREFDLHLVQTSNIHPFYDNITYQEYDHKPIDGVKCVKDVINEKEQIQLETFDEVKYMDYNTWVESQNIMGTVYYVEEGLKHLPNRMYSFLKDHIKLEYSVDKIGNNGEVHYNGKIQKFDKIIIATSIEDSIIEEINTMANSYPTVRVYIEFNELPDIFEKYDSVTSNKSFRWAIKINEKIVLISYVDGDRANYFIKKTDKEIINEICKDLKIDKKTIKKYWIAKWKDAFTVIPCFKMNKLKNDYYKINEIIYQSCVPYIYEQAWMEGHLIQIKEIINYLTQS